MKRIVISTVAALALLVTVASDANARPRWGVSVGYGSGYYYGAPGYSVSYGTRVGDGVINVGYSSYAYPTYYSAPVYYSSPYYYSTPVYYSTPTYYSTPYYYGGYYSYPRYRWGW